MLHIHVVGANSMQPSFDVIGLTTWGFDRKMMLRHTADGGLVGGRPMENPLKISQNERSSYELERIHLQLDMHIYIFKYRLDNDCYQGLGHTASHQTSLCEAQR